MHISGLPRALLLVPALVGVVLGGETSILSALRVAPPSELSDLAILTPATDDQMQVVRNMGFLGPGFLGRTPQGRLVFSAPRMHGIAYQIPSPHRTGFSELLTAHHGEEGGSVQSFGYMPSIKWSQGAPVHDLAFKVNDRTYLLADAVDTGGVSVLRAPERDGMTPVTERFPAHVEQRYTGPVTE